MSQIKKWHFSQCSEFTYCNASCYGRPFVDHTGVRTPSFGVLY
jgi:hypothetical protein